MPKTPEQTETYTNEGGPLGPMDLGSILQARKSYLGMPIGPELKVKGVSG